MNRWIRRALPVMALLTAGIGRIERTSAQPGGMCNVTVEWVELTQAVQADPRKWASDPPVDLIERRRTVARLYLQKVPAPNGRFSCSDSVCAIYSLNRKQSGAAQTVGAGANCIVPTANAGAIDRLVENATINLRFLPGDAATFVQDWRLKIALVKEADQVQELQTGSRLQSPDKTVDFKLLLRQSPRVLGIPINYQPPTPTSSITPDPSASPTPTPTPLPYAGTPDPHRVRVGASMAHDIFPIPGSGWYRPIWQPDHFEHENLIRLEEDENGDPQAIHIFPGSAPRDRPVKWLNTSSKRVELRRLNQNGCDSIGPSSVVLERFGFPDPDKTMHVESYADAVTCVSYRFLSAGQSQNLQFDLVDSGALLNPWTKDLTDGANLSALNEAVDKARRAFGVTNDFAYGWLCCNEDNPLFGTVFGDNVGRTAVGVTLTDQYLATFAHELAHTFGFGHPDESGQPVTTREVGWDAELALSRVGAGWSPPAQFRLVRPDDLLDILCCEDSDSLPPGEGVPPPNERYWVSKELWTGITFEQGADSGTGNPVKIYPKSRPQNSNDVSWPPIAIPPRIEYLHIDASFPADPSEPTDLGRFDAMDGHAAILPSFGGNAKVRLLDGAGQSLYSTDLTVPAGTPSRVSLDVPWDAAAQRVELWRDGMVVASRDRSSAAPVISGLSLQAGDVLTDTTLIEWTATDADGDPVTTDIYYSHNGGLTWWPVRLGSDEGAYFLDVSWLPGSTGTASLRLVATDGFNRTVVEVNGLITVPDRAPEAEIVDPVAGAVLPYGVPVVLEASANDIEDGAVDVATGVDNSPHVAWFSNVSGPLGTGARLTVATAPIGTMFGLPTLAPGPHMITMVATDRSGNHTTDQIWLAVQSPTYVNVH